MLNEKALNLQPQGLRMRTHIIPLVVVNEHAELILNRCKVLMYAGSHKGGHSGGYFDPSFECFLVFSWSTYFRSLSGEQKQR